MAASYHETGVQRHCTISMTCSRSETDSIFDGSVQPVSPGEEKLENVCNIFKNRVKNTGRKWVVAKTEGQLALWQEHDPERIFRKIRVLPFATVTNLRVLLGSTELDNDTKRALGLTFAYSLLLCYDSKWLPRGWNKEDIVFFGNEDNLFDTEYPFLAPTPQSGHWAKTLHRNQEIMTLGVLLVEIFEKKPIESHITQMDRDSCDETPVDWRVATKVAKGMGDSPARWAIEACLYMRWADGMESCALDNGGVREKFYEHVIAPLDNAARWKSWCDRQ